jgi:ribonuclease D
MTDARFQLCDTAESMEALASAISGLDGSGFISLDTEFARTTTFVPKAALLQLRFDGRIYLADPVKSDPAAVVGALCRTQRTVLTFSSREDLEVIAFLARKAGVEPRLPAHIEDLQLMGSFLGRGHMLGLAACVHDELGVTLEKAETNSDWLARPLTASQLEYAALDVLYLEDLRERYMRGFAEDDRRLRWFADEMSCMCAEALKEPDPKELYRQVRGAGALHSKALQRLCYLCARRYEYAVEHDEALNRIITGKALCSIAEHTPLTSQGLASCGMNWGAVREHGKMVIDWVKESMSLPDEEVAPAYDAFSPGRTMRSNAEGMKRVLTNAALKAGISPELISSKKLINDWFYARRTGGTAKLSSGWCRECLDGVDLKSAALGRRR